MNKGELVDKVAAEGKITKADADRLVKVVLGSMTDSLTNGEKITIPGFGTFEVRERAAKQGRNPQTGATVEIPARKAVAFKPGKTLKDVLNK